MIDTLYFCMIDIIEVYFISLDYTITNVQLLIIDVSAGRSNDSVAEKETVPKSLEYFIWS